MGVSLLSSKAQRKDLTEGWHTLTWMDPLKLSHTQQWLRQKKMSKLKVKFLF